MEIVLRFPVPVQATIAPMSASDYHQLVALLQEFSQASDRYVESTGAQYETHRTDMNALSIIMKYERRGVLPSPRDLSQDLQLSAPATTAMLDRLKRLGLIERRRSDQDRRVVRIALTDKARAKGKEMFFPLASQMLEVIDQYDAQQLELITGFVRKAVAGIDLARESVVTQVAQKSMLPATDTSLKR